MTGGGKPLWQKLSNILFKFIRLSPEKPKQKFLFRQIISSKGAILIEFAFCLPVLILLIYYIYDLNRLKRYYSQTEFVGQQVASMIQNISQSRESKAITRKDIQYILKLAYLSIYPGLSMYRQAGYYEFGHAPMCNIIYVKGLENGNASCIWSMCCCHFIFNSYSVFEYGQDYPFFRPLHFLTNVVPSKIYPSLTINPGEVKIMVNCTIFRQPTVTKSFNGKYLTDKESFNFYLLSPKYNTYNNWYYFFPSVVIFTPRPGLFSESPPV